MRVIDLWALTADLKGSAPLKTKADAELLSITNFYVDQSAHTLILQARAVGTAKTLASFFQLAQQPQIRQLAIRVQRVDVPTAPARIIFGCSFKDQAVVLK